MRILLGPIAALILSVCAAPAATDIDRLYVQIPDSQGEFLIPDSGGLDAVLNLKPYVTLFIQVRETAEESYMIQMVQAKRGDYRLLLFKWVDWDLHRYGHGTDEKLSLASKARKLDIDSANTIYAFFVNRAIRSRYGLNPGSTGGVTSVFLVAAETASAQLVTGLGLEYIKGSPSAKFIDAVGELRTAMEADDERKWQRALSRMTKEVR